MKVALAQMDVKPAHPKHNLESMVKMAKEAKANGADVICFSELMFGYMLGDKWTEDETVQELMGYNQIMQKVSEHIPVIYGNIYVDDRDGIHPNKDGRSRKFNAIYAYQDGKPVKRATQTSMPDGIEAKTLLPNYRFFDDERYFFSKLDHAMDEGETLENVTQPFVFDIQGKEVKIGIETCEDTWDSDYRRNGEALNVSKILIENGAEYIFNLSASPWTVGKHHARDRRIKESLTDANATAHDDFKGFFYVNNVGAQNNGKNIITFDGGTTVYNAQGQPVAAANMAGEEEILYIDAPTIPNLAPLTRTEEKPIAQKYRALITGIRHMKDIQGRAEQPNWLVPVSGGIDSAVVIALLVDAVGKDKVGGVNYPTIYNGDDLKSVAKELCENLGIRYSVVPIQDAANAIEFAVSHAPQFGKELTALDKGNMIAKTRFNIHSTLAAVNGAIYPNCGNKTELMIGYFTLDADGRGALSIIGDCPKDEVYELATYINERAGREIIPNRIIRYEEDARFLPSAELESNQKDPIHIPYHGPLTRVLMDYKKATPITILEWYKDGTLTKKLGVRPDELERAGLETPAKFIDNLEWFTKQKDWSVFKRVQGPPIIVLSKTAFGFDLRESMLPYTQTQAYQAKKAEILGTEFSAYADANRMYAQYFKAA
jgi:NAD+ synthase (glutamine-hydrolysing)